MATSSSTATTTSESRQSSGNFSETQAIPQQLKFLMSHIKGIISLTLTAENFPIWRSQVFKLFKANGFEGFLDDSCLCPSPHHQTMANELSFQTWNLLDQNLAVALYSIISPSILPYVLSLDHCAEIWETIARRLQSNTRSRTIQLRNELHHLSMKNQSMPQYLLSVKSIVDAIAATGSPLDPEEVIFDTLNGLPVQYQSFKTSIRTNLQPLSLDDLYTLLCSEELNLAQENTIALQNLHLNDPATALAAYRGRGRGRTNSDKGRNTGRGRSRSDKNSSSGIICQICSKTGHSAIKCWYRNDPSYNEDSIKTALFTPSEATTTTDWFLDSGASNHLTFESSNLQAGRPYTGNQQITVGNGYQLPIQHTGKGILPTPKGLEDGSNSSQGTLP
ncbi:Retrovirus-related Pol polyprotein from transposon TNT 1-94 [Dendrobium catenatum]|uniref:Retrovirus-related Pol polyprotein from transposon TNT 1-94 n=1 Tax=Dendrobium catenatum TaxID=906689 RepID=A0A2I0WUH1_9ASPA|nr:Retrovirus-related Pol polyprotein from transposon TNT 1-94 [Dendrobium catenatum]